MKTLKKKSSTSIKQPVHPYIHRVLESVKNQNPHETLFLQAVQEVLETLTPLIDDKPEIEAHALLERMCEPERQILFRVVWQDDRGKVHVNRGFRTEFSSALGPYKGGLRFHPTVNTSVIKFLAFEQVFKNSLTGLQLGGGKGGSDFDPKGQSESEIMRFCQAFMSELFRHIGDHTDVPAGDMGVGGREIGYLFGQYKKLKNRFEPSVLTGKNVGFGGSLCRKEATGFGAVYFAQFMLECKGEDFKGKQCIVSGSGNVALYAIQKLIQLGAKVVACSESNGYLYDSNGLDVDHLIQIKEINRERLHIYLKKYPKAVYKENAKIWDVPCDYAFPCATQNEIDRKDAEKLVKNGCKLVAEGANMPSSSEAIKVFQEAQVLFAPGKAANAGGVAVSGLEMQQNVGWTSWTFEQVDLKLREIMKSIHENCMSHASKYSKPDDYVSGANIAGFLRVAYATQVQGLI